jgi:hypothetical protein
MGNVAIFYMSFLYLFLYIYTLLYSIFIHFKIIYLFSISIFVYV